MPRTWSSVGDTDMNDGANYDGAGALLVTDDLVFDGTSVINATATGALSVASITVAVGYTGVFNDGGQAFAVSGLVSITPGGTLTTPGTWTQTGDANFGIFVGGTQNTSSMSVILQGTGTAVLPPTIAVFTCGAVGKVTTTATRNFKLTGAFTVGAGTLTNNKEIDIVPDNMALTGGYTWNGTGVVLWQPLTGTYACPVFTTTNTIEINGYRTTPGATFNFGGAISCKSMRIRARGNNSVTVVNTGDFAITCSIDFSYGSSNAGSTLTLNAGASVVTCVTYGAIALNDGTSTQTLNMGTSAWTVTGNWITQSNHTLTVSAWTLNFTGNSTDFTAAGETFGEVVNNKTAGQTLTMIDALACTSYTNTQGTIDTGGFSITTSAEFDLTAGIFTANASAISVGTDCTIANVAGLFVAGTSTVTLAGTGNISNPHFDNRFHDLVQGNSVTTTMTGNVYDDNSVTLGTGSTWQDDNVALRQLIIDTAGCVMTVNNVVWNNQGQLLIRFQGGANVCSDDFGTTTLRVNEDNALMGDVTCGKFIVYRANNIATCTSAGYDLTCSSLELGQTGVSTSGGVLKLTATSALTVSGNIDIFADDGVKTNILQVDTAGTNAIVCGGNWTVGSGGAFDAQSSVVNFNGAAAQTITSAGTQFYSIWIDNSHADGVTFADAMDSQGTLTFDSTGSAIRVDFDETGSHVWTTVAQTGANVVTLRSEVNANQWDVACTNDATLAYIDVQDSNLSGATMKCDDRTSVDGGNNSKYWDFVLAAQQHHAGGMYLSHMTVGI